MTELVQFPHAGVDPLAGGYHCLSYGPGDVTGPSSCERTKDSGKVKCQGSCPLQLDEAIPDSVN